jgi:dipeptide transport system substrate-binding protein
MNRAASHIVGIFVLFFSLLVSSHAIAAKTFIFCSEGSPSSFNPQLVTDAPSNVVANAIYNRLVEFEPGVTGIVPRLVESWVISKDNLEYTFKIRKDVKFHKTSYFTPTRNMNADDVLFSFNRQRLATHPYNAVSGGHYEYFKSMGMDQTIKDVIKLDDYTVKFTLSKPEASFLSNLAMEFFIDFIR